jgi:hypothetical protein
MERSDVFQRSYSSFPPGPPDSRVVPEAISSTILAQFFHGARSLSESSAYPTGIIIAPDFLAKAV